MGGLIDVKWKGIMPIGCWANYVTLTFNQVHDLVLESSKSMTLSLLKIRWWLRINTENVV